MIQQQQPQRVGLAVGLVLAAIAVDVVGCASGQPGKPALYAAAGMHAPPDGNPWDYRGVRTLTSEEHQQRGLICPRERIEIVEYEVSSEVGCARVRVCDRERLFGLIESCGEVRGGWYTSPDKVACSWEWHEVNEAWWGANRKKC